MEQVVSSIITGLFAVLVLVLGVRINRKVTGQGQAIAAVRNQVVNGHTTNMREEGDQRHEENTHKLDTILEELTAVRRSVARLWVRSDEHTTQLHELELTSPPSRFAPPTTARHRKEPHHE